MTLAARQAAANWKTWDGRSPCPVARDRKVSVMLRDGFVHQGRAGQWTWQRGQAPYDAEPDDIVAYRVWEPAHIVSLRRRAA